MRRLRVLRARKEACSAVACVFLVVFAARGDTQQFGKPDPDLDTVSLVSLIASPEKFEGRRVRVKGPASFGEDGDAVCLSKSDIEGSVAANCVTILLEPEKLGMTKSGLENAGDLYVIVEGTFDSKYRGRYGRTSGCIDQVTRLYLDKREESMAAPPKGAP